jgi:SAM-dependent methyltransferase
MLIDHNNLEEFSDPVNYDVEDASDTGVAFYTALAQETSGPVLEIACGTGRVSIPIARLGFDVTGLDIVPGMLEQARGKAAGLPTRWVEGDARTFDLGEQFRLIFLTGNAFQAFLTNADQEALLQRVRTYTMRDCLPSRRATRSSAIPRAEKGNLLASSPARRKKIGLPSSTPVAAKCECRKRGSTTMSLRSCIG